jgi:hypothetical protein
MTKKMTPEQVSEHRKRSMIIYMNKTTVWIKPYIHKWLDPKECIYLNVQELDDTLCEELADNTELCDGRRRWVELYRPVRIRILIRYLTMKQGYEMWSGASHKVLYKPAKSSKQKVTTKK